MRPLRRWMPENEAVIMEVLAKLKERITIVFVTHSESVTRWFDSVIKTMRL